jgi:hypothetical protein
MADIDGNDNDVAQHSPAATAAAAEVIIKPKKPKSEAWHAAIPLSHTKSSMGRKK